MTGMTIGRAPVKAAAARSSASGRRQQQQQCGGAAVHPCTPASYGYQPRAYGSDCCTRTVQLYRYHLYMKLRALVTLVRNEGQRASHVRTA